MVGTVIVFYKIYKLRGVSLLVKIFNMVKINVRGKEIEIHREHLIRERGPPREEWCPSEKEGSWSIEGYDRALAKVRGALEKLDDLKNSYRAKELSPEQLADRLEHFRNFYATYTRSITDRSRGIDDPTDPESDTIKRVYDLGGIVCETAQEMAGLAKKDG